MASGRYYANWRADFTNIAAGGTCVTSWNQPQYPPAGVTTTDKESVTIRVLERNIDQYL